MKKIKIEFVLIFFLVIIILIVKNISYKSFLDYEDTIVTQQKEHLLTIAKSTARNLELYVDEKTKAIENLSKNFNFEQKQNKQKKIILREFKNFYISQKNEISELHYLKLDRNLQLNENKIINYPEYTKFQNKTSFTNHINKGIEIVKKTKKNYIENPFREKDGSFSFYIFQPVIYKGQLKGVLLGKIKVEKMYKLIVESIRAGKYGYAMVKDSKGTILMHPVKEQIGYDVIKSRKEKYPNLDFSELEDLIKKQLLGKEGTYIYHSYWWPQNKLVRVKKLNGFAPAFITEDFWVIAVVMSYDEISKPIKKYFYSSMIVSAIIIVIFACTIYLIIKIIKTKEAYQMETAYLKELNETAEKLRKKEAELHHRRKLETIGTLTSGIAHEFNNILTPIMGYSEMILRKLDPDEDIYEDVKVIYDSSKRSQEIIDQILTYSRDSFPAKYKIILLNKVLKDIIKILESLVPSNIKIEQRIEMENGYIFANETQIHQLVLNLCTNACNAMTKSNVKKLRLELKTNQNKNGKVYNKISIKDTGIGMTKSTIDKIFDPFFTNKLSEKSTGLGLSVAIGIIEKHGGEIEVNSELGKGSCFDVYLPRANQNNEENFKITKIAKDELRGNEKILIIDNDEAIAEMLKKGLSDLGYKASFYTNGLEVVKKFNPIIDNYKVVITDLTMPEISGIHLAKRLKMINNDLKIILVTAHSEEPLENYKQNKVIDDYLLKPISISEISLKIRKLLKTK